MRPARTLARASCRSAPSNLESGGSANDARNAPCDELASGRSKLVRVTFPTRARTDAPPRTVAIWPPWTRSHAPSGIPQGVGCARTMRMSPGRSYFAWLKERSIAARRAPQVAPAGHRSRRVDSETALSMPRRTYWGYKSRRPVKFAAQVVTLIVLSAVGNASPLGGG